MFIKLSVQNLEPVFQGDRTVSRVLIAISHIRAIEEAEGLGSYVILSDGRELLVQEDLDEIIERLRGLVL